MGFNMDYIPEDTLHKRAYREFVLDKVDEDNIKEIERNLKDGKINSSNKLMMLEYLETLHHKIAGVKRMEYEYEGDANMNVNRYLMRIKTLIDKIHMI